MDKIRFADGKEIEVIRVVGGTQFIQNAQRETLTITAKGEASGFDAFLQSFADTGRLTIVEAAPQEAGSTAKPTEHLYEDYTILFKRAIEQEQVSPETPNAPAVLEDVFVIGLAQKTYLEKLVEQLTKKEG